MRWQEKGRRRVSYIADDLPFSYSGGLFYYQAVFDVSVIE
tara:strand:+ start:501 stop:620 length:120 start_codon:yes stop_codon:yes gene_type:complete